MKLTEAFESVAGRRVVMLGGKGGVGKKTVAVNLALARSDAGARVGILAPDCAGPNEPLMVAARGEPRSRSKNIQTTGS